MICRVCRKVEGVWLKEDGTHYSSCDECRDSGATARQKRSGPRSLVCKKCKEYHNDKKMNGMPYKFCSSCRACLTEKSNVRKSGKQKVEDGKCRACGEASLQGGIYCGPCAEKNRLKSRKYRDNRKKNNLCLHCGGLKEICEIQRCFKCVLKHTSTSTLGNRSRWKEMGVLLYRDQKRKCVYTNRLLTLGIDASLDHKVPLCLGGSHDLSNLQWVHTSVNIMKGRMTEEEFLRMVGEICVNTSKYF